MANGKTFAWEKDITEEAYVKTLMQCLLLPGGFSVDQLMFHLTRFLQWIEVFHHEFISMRVAETVYFIPAYTLTSNGALLEYKLMYGKSI